MTVKELKQWLNAENITDDMPVILQGDEEGNDHYGLRECGLCRMKHVIFSRYEPVFGEEEANHPECLILIP